MYSKIKNLTKHKLILISTEDVVPADRYSGKFLLKKPMEQTRPLFELDPITALNVHETKGYGTEFSIGGVRFQAAQCYTESVDGFNGVFFDEDSLFVVSRRYADAAKFKLPPHLLDRLFVPAGVVERNGRIVGCTRLLKVAPFQVPSFYLNMTPDYATKRMAIEHWRMHWSQLPPQELEALQLLSASVTSNY